jgi:hypothetical protein
MTKRDIIAKLNTDLGSAEALLKAINEDGHPTTERLHATIGYIKNTLEWIQQEGKV